MNPGQASPVYIKRYPGDASRDRARAGYEWLAGNASPLVLPRLVAAGPGYLAFEQVSGRHAGLRDLSCLSEHLGAAHSAAWSAGLRHARLGHPYRVSPGLVLPGFPQWRLAAVTRELRTGRVPGPVLTVRQAAQLIRGACRGPAAFYKDANPRNFLITAAGPVTIDFDDITLAPAGYDLAKLVVTLAMTSGPIPDRKIAAGLNAYNHAAGPDLGPVRWDQLMAWAEIHHILTSRYLGQGGYRYSWHTLRPGATKPGAPWR